MLTFAVNAQTTILCDERKLEDAGKSSRGEK